MRERRGPEAARGGSLSWVHGPLQPPAAKWATWASAGHLSAQRVCVPVCGSGVLTAPTGCMGLHGVIKRLAQHPCTVSAQ